MRKDLRVAVYDSQKNRVVSCDVTVANSDQAVAFCHPVVDGRVEKEVGEKPLGVIGLNVGSSVTL